MNSLRQKRCDILRQKINEPGFPLPIRCHLAANALQRSQPEPCQFLINDWQSQKKS
jgi:hypothetical protein